jgi:hypothetical protein
VRRCQNLGGLYQKKGTGKKPPHVSGSGQCPKEDNMIQLWVLAGLARETRMIIQCCTGSQMGGGWNYTARPFYAFGGIVVLFTQYWWIAAMLFTIGIINDLVRATFPKLNPDLVEGLDSVICIVLLIFWSVKIGLF